ncbi:hypothetical protein Tco_0628974 [Tanacetum coccineum]|uniref:Uncharacterized protein n=1 Tax=Tanacetum coccineum TaxID=301880 RepID=A0ABQ4WRX8_9ASTR
MKSELTNPFAQRRGIKLLGASQQAPACLEQADSKPSSRPSNYLVHQANQSDPSNFCLALSRWRAEDLQGGFGGECAISNFNHGSTFYKISMLHVPPENNEFEGEIIPCSDCRLGTSQPCG